MFHVKHASSEALTAESPAMPTSQTVEAFIARVVSGAHAEAIEEFYTADASMQENGNPPRVGRNLLVAHERRALARATSVHTTHLAPTLVNGEYVVIRWVFVFHGKDGSTMRIEELAWQRWEGEKIAQETFFYDPIQMKPA